VMMVRKIGRIAVRCSILCLYIINENYLNKNDITRRSYALQNEDILFGLVGDGKFLGSHTSASPRDLYCIGVGVMYLKDGTENTYQRLDYLHTCTYTYTHTHTHTHTYKQICNN